MSPRTKQLGIVGAVLVLFAGTAWLLQDDDQPVPGTKSTTEQKLQGLISGQDPRDMGLTGVARDVDGMQAELAELKQQIADGKRRDGSSGRSESQTRTPAEPSAEFEAMKAEIELLKLQQLNGAVNGTAQGLPSTPPGTVVNGARPPSTSTRSQVGSAVESMRETPPIVGAMRTIGADPEPAPASAGGTGLIKTTMAKRYLPPGTMLSGVLLTGIDAPTGNSAQREPIPVLMRVKHDAILPNRYRADVKECFALLSGYGDLSSERAYLRGERFSCVTRSGGVIDIKLNVYAVGSDSKAGIRGRLVSKQGAQIGKALLAGLAQGAAQVFSRPQSNFSVGGAIDPSQLATQGVGQGAGSALDRVAQYWIERADQTFPIIEISGGRAVTLVVTVGTELAPLSD